jgi:hypothetical protein
MTNTPRGIRNNNPLNIRHSPSRWQGMAVEQTDPSFVQFRSMAYGYRAACKLLQSYWQRFRKEGKPFTVRTIISRWAPPEDNNDTESYIRSVLLIGGLGGQEILFPPDNPLGYGRLERLLIAMTCVESGIGTNRVDSKMILQGYRMAFPHVREVSECNKLADFR